MRRLAGVLVAAGLVAVAGHAHAFGKVGIRVGSGFSFVEDVPGDPETDPPFAAGLAWKADLVALGVEVDALYWRTALDGGGGDAVEHRLALPVIARIGFPIVPAVLSLDFGAGLEPRFLLGSDIPGGEEAKGTVLYLPIALGATLDLQLIEGNAEIRYERQITSNFETVDDARNHQLMVFFGAFF